MQLLTKCKTLLKNQLELTLKYGFTNLGFLYFIVPVQSRHADNAEEEEDEDEAYEPESRSESETEESNEEEEEEEEIDNERFVVSDDEEEIPAEVKSVKVKKNLAQEAKERKASASKRKAPTSIRSGGVKKAKTAKGDVKKRPSIKPKGGQTTRKPPRKKSKQAEENEIDETVEIIGEGDKKKTADGKTVDGDKKTAKLVEFNDKNVDYNLYNEAPEHIKQMKVKLSSNILMFSRMIEATSGSTAQGLSYDYAALSFQRNTRTGKAYEFNLPLALAPTVIKGIQFLIKNNPKFFEKYLPLSIANKAVKDGELAE